MSVDDRARHELHARLAEVLGPEPADTLMRYLPPVGWPDVARKRDLDAFADRLEAVISRELGGSHGALAAQTRTLLLGMSGLSIMAAGIAFAAARLA